jgi:predicted RNA-binding Zn-ribbon protein involved in translation (DUF1610 family)
MATLTCTECGESSRDDAERWRAYLVDGDDEEDEVVFYCPSCSSREFGSSASLSDPD